MTPLARLRRIRRSFAEDRSVLVEEFTQVRESQISAEVRVDGNNVMMGHSQFNERPKITAGRYRVLFIVQKLPDRKPTAR